jgi:hypothetical protein
MLVRSLPSSVNLLGLAFACSILVACRGPIAGTTEEGQEQDEDEMADDTPLPDMAVHACQHDRDPERSDCPAGEKCMPHGTDLWEDGCFPLADTPLEIGASCEDEDQLDGLDPCVAGSMCILQDGGQVCSPFCTFTDGDYTCPSDDQSCTLGSAQGNRWCLDNCDPLASNCADGTCNYVGNGFLCTFTGTKQYGEPCAFDHECDSGMGCVAQTEIEGCDGGCCTPYCSVGGDPCPEAANGQECLLIYEAPEAFAHVGACAWPA